MSSTRLFRWITLVGMEAGIAIVVIALLDFARSSIGGPVADIIPNFSLSPLAPITGVSLFLVSAIARRRLLRTSGLASNLADPARHSRS